MEEGLRSETLFCFRLGHLFSFPAFREELAQYGAVFFSSKTKFLIAMKRFLLFLAALTLAFVLQAQTSAGSHAVDPAASRAETRTTLHFAVDDHRNTGATP